MMIIDGYEITAFTNLSEEVCLKIFDIVQNEFGEIGDFLIEDEEVSFRVSMGYFETAPKIIKADKLKLKLIDKSDYYFSVGYKIIIPNRISDIQPALISQKITNKRSENYRRVIESFKQFNKRNNRCMPIKYIEYELKENGLKFKEISYQSLFL